MCFNFYISDSFRPSGSILGNGSQIVKINIDEPLPLFS